MCMADLQWHDDSPVVASPRQILRASSTGSPSAAGPRWRPPSSSSSSSATPTSRRSTRATATSSPATSTTSTTRCSAPRALEPLIGRIRREMARAGLRWRTPRASATSASTRSTSPTRTRCGAADTHTIYKNGAKEIAAQEGMAITFMAKYDEREGNSCHIHLSVRGEDGRRCSPTQPELFDRFLAGQLACLRELTLFKAPQRQLLQALRRGLLRAHRGGVGPRQPHLLDARDRPGPVAAGREPAAGRRRQPLPGARGDDRRRPARDRQRARARAGARGQRLHVRQAARADHAARRARAVRRRARSRARRSARRSSTTTSTTPTSSCAPSRRP